LPAFHTPYLVPDGYPGARNLETLIEPASEPSETPMPPAAILNWREVAFPRTDPPPRQLSRQARLSSHSRQTTRPVECTTRSASALLAADGVLLRIRITPSAMRS
jgi:hypothetical protein